MIKNGQFRLLSLLLTLAMVLSLLGGCGKDSYEKLATPVPAVSTPADTPVTLWVVTDKSNLNYQMNYLLENLADTYMDVHQNVTINIEYLSDETEEREVQLQRIRASILADDGPDVFLMSGRSPYYGNEPLFLDVEQSMWNGVFHDISAYYNADVNLATEELNETVMNAGKIGDARYILPLYYDLPVLQIHKTALSEYGLTEADVTSSLFALMDKIQEIGDPGLAYSVCWNVLNSYFAFDFFPELIDYRDEQLLVTEDELAEYMRKYQQWAALQAKADEDYGVVHHEGVNGIASYVKQNQFWRNANYIIHIGNLSSSLACAAIAKVENEEISMYPLRASDGSAVASVAYWGSVGAGCEYPDVAYDFLRQFLTRDAQWEISRPQVSGKVARTLYCGEGVPVRTKGMVEPLYESMKNQAEAESMNPEKSDRQRELAIKNQTLSDSDFSILEVQIDQVRFYCDYEIDFDYALNELNDRNNNHAPTDADVNALAKEFIKQLEYLLAEG